MNNNSSKQVLLSVIGVAILVVAVVGVSFAFFNYSRTSDKTNTLTTGTIVFSSTDTGFRTGLNNVFPISATDAANESCTTGTNVGCASVTVTGTTTYGQGIDFQVLLKDVNTSSLNSVMLNALTFIVDTGSTSEHISAEAVTINSTNFVNDTAIVTGHIDGTGTELTKTINIKAYYDISKIFITDTPSDSYTQQRAGNRYSNMIVSTTDWNNKSVSFGIRVVADQGGYVAS